MRMERSIAATESSIDQLKVGGGGGSRSLLIWVWCCCSHHATALSGRQLRLPLACDPLSPSSRLQGELAEAHAQRAQLEAQLEALQQQAQSELRSAPAAASVDDLLGGLSPALPATPTAAAISNPVFSPDKEVAELHQQVGGGFTASGGPCLGLGGWAGWATGRSRAALLGWPTLQQALQACGARQARADELMPTRCRPLLCLPLPSLRSWRRCRASWLRRSRRAWRCSKRWTSCGRWGCSR